MPESAVYLVPLAFLTSTLAGAVGLGGGVILITLMPGLLPAAAILPLHAATQLASNASRALFGWRQIDLHLIPPLLAGAAIGAVSGGLIYRTIDVALLPAVIGILILLITWVPLPPVRGGGKIGLWMLGFYQTGVGMVAGATGPLGAAVLARHSRERDYLVVNTGVYMTINHLLRVVAFSALGFSLLPWWPLLLALVAAVVAGSWLGTRLRRYLPRADFHRLFRWLVSLLALRMVVMAF
jgi:uncharacterized membrane protein YfcA